MKLGMNRFDNVISRQRRVQLETIVAHIASAGGLCLFVLGLL